MTNTKSPNLFNDRISILIYISAILLGQLLLLPFGRTLAFLYVVMGMLTLAYIPMLLVEKISAKFWKISPNPKQRRISFLIYLLAGSLFVVIMFIVQR